MRTLVFLLRFLVNLESRVVMAPAVPEFPETVPAIRR